MGVWAFSWGCGSYSDNIGSTASLSRLSVSGNQIVNEQSQAIRLRGVNIEDPFILENQDIDDDGVADPHFSNVGEDFNKIKAMGANTVRLAVVPGFYFLVGESYLTDYLDPLIDLAKENSLYAIIDYHAIGRPGGWYPDEFDDTTVVGYSARLYYTDMDMAISFWDTVAARYGDRSHVLFDIYNEPADETETFGWSDWRPYGELLISAIRTHSQNLIFGPGPYWTSDLSEVPTNPYSDSGIVYVAHIYPGSLDEGADQLEEWKNRFGTLADTYPVMVSEWGFNQNGDTVTMGTEQGYAEPLLDYINSKDLHWLAYIYHPLAEPPMVERDWSTLTEFGRFVEGQFSN